MTRLLITLVEKSQLSFSYLQSRSIKCMIFIYNYINQAIAMLIASPLFIGYMKTEKINELMLDNV